ncbi:MAG: cytochrome b [Burkholderiales bacterium]|jgi:cytochrome b561|nr:cytochrome b [Burkholderiales bacterium]
MLSNTENSYGSLTKFFHWTIAFLIIFMLFCGYLMTGLKWLNYHKLIGLTIFSLAVLRVIWTLINKQPKLPQSMPLYEKILAHTVQFLLYVFMLGMPLSGWAMASAFGQAPHVFGVQFSMPFIAINPQLGIIFEQIHNTAAIALITVLGLHLVGALRHHFLIKDDVLKKMLPFGKID